MLANKRALLKLLRAAKSFKAEVSWSKIERDWDEYWTQFAGEEWRKAFMPMLQGIITAQDESINTTFGMEFDVRNLFSEAYLRDTDFGYWFENYVDTFSEPVLETTKKDLRALLLQAQQNGWTIEQMREQLDLNWDKYLDPKFTLEGRGLTEEERGWFEERNPRYRKDLIARDQTMRASNTGGYYLYRAWGAPMKEWLATGDARTRDTHLVAWQMYSEGGNPGPIPIEMPFKVGGFSVMYPGDPAGPPEETIQCRCSTLPHFPEFAGTEEEVAQARAGMETEIGRREGEQRRRRRGEPWRGVAGQIPVGEDHTTEFMEKWFTEGLEITQNWRDAPISAQGRAKDELVRAISERSGIPYESVNKIIKQWAKTSNDNDMRSLAMQKAAVEHFGVPLSDFSEGKIDLILQKVSDSLGRDVAFEELYELGIGQQRIHPQYSPLMENEQLKTVLGAMYENTQERLAAAGFGPGTTIRMRRGVYLPTEVTKDWEVGDTVPIEGNAIESWSIGPDISARFGGTIFEMDVPVEMIVGSARSGYGCLTEGEFVILGSTPSEAKLLRVGK